jgi:Ankyrin repeats (3 copies)
MKVKIIAPARVEPASKVGATTANTSCISANDSVHENDADLALYLPTELADLGIVGGRISFQMIDNDLGEITVTFWSPELLPELVVDALKQDVLAQMSDGIGEGGFLVPEIDAYVTPCDDDVESYVALQEADETPVPPLPYTAIAARDGDIEALKIGLERRHDPDVTHQGFPALHLAILYGHLEAIDVLLAHGVNPNLESVFGDTALMLCATSRAIDDTQAVSIASRLIKKGARKDLKDKHGQSARELAVLRGRAALAELLT